MQIGLGKLHEVTVKIGFCVTYIRLCIVPGLILLILARLRLQAVE